MAIALAAGHYMLALALRVLGCSIAKVCWGCEYERHPVSISFSPARRGTVLGVLRIVQLPTGSKNVLFFETR